MGWILFGLEGEKSDFGGAVEAEGDAYGADAAVDVELHLVEVEDAVGVDPAHGGEDEWAQEGELDLASVGVAREHEVDERAAGVLGDDVGEVGLVGHKDNGAVGVGGNGEVEIRMAGAGVFCAAEPETGAVALDGDVLIDEDGGSVGGEGANDHAGADGDIVIAEDGVAEGAGEGREEFGTAVSGVVGRDKCEGSHGDKVSGDEDEVDIEGVDMVDDAFEEVGLSKFFEVDIADLGDTVATEGVRQVCYGDGAVDHVNLMAGYFACVES